VDELRHTLAEVEQALDQFFRTPREKVPLAKVAHQLTQMRGVLSVLGLDQASYAVMRMRETVDGYMADDLGDASVLATSFDKLGNSLGALGFLIDMLGYQRALAKKLFAYDEEAGEFKLAMGRSTVSAADSVQAPYQDVPEERVPEPLPVLDAEPWVSSALPSVSELDLGTGPDVLESAAPEPAAMLASVSVALEPTVEPEFTLTSAMPDLGRVTEISSEPVVSAESVDAPDEDAELLGIFLDEAREVVRTGLGAVAALLAAPSDVGPQITLRRAFHTLKGSARMVGLSEFGEASWAMEQMVNGWLAEQSPAHPDLLQVAGDALNAFGLWVEDIAVGEAIGMPNLSELLPMPVGWSCALCRWRCRKRLPMSWLPSRCGI
jgi:chemosensory pili system protein ChpA (sensor histidine kinase/response regulator)